MYTLAHSRKPKHRGHKVEESMGNSVGFSDIFGCKTPNSSFLTESF